MNIKRYIAGGLLTLITAASFYSCDLKDPLDGVQIVVNTDFIKTQVAVSIVDAATGFSIENGVALSISGDDREQVVNISGRPEFNLNEGIITLALKQGVTPTDSKPVTFTVSASASGYLTSYQTVEIKSDGMYMYEVKMTNLKDLPDGAIRDEGNITDDGIIVLNTTMSTGLRAGGLTYDLIRYDASESALNTLPLPVVSSGKVLTPLVAMHLVIKENGTAVKQLENPVKVTLPLTSSLEAGTSLSVFSYDNTSGKWTNESVQGTVGNDGKSVSFSVNKIAYYWAIGNAYPAESVKMNITSKAVGDEVYTFSYYINNEYAGSEQRNVLKGTNTLQSMSIPQGAKVRITNYAEKVLYEGATANIVLSNESSNVITFILKATCDSGDIGVRVIPSTIIFFREKGTNKWQTSTVQSGENQLSDIKLGATYEVKVNYDQETYSGDLVPNEHVTGKNGSVYEFDFELPDDFC